ncbi:MAG: ABC transporter substrate-binding protein [Patescibacteria group bacterium]
MKKRNNFLLGGIIFTIIAIIGIGLWYQNSLQDNSLSNVENKGVLVVGSSLPYGQMEFFDNNKPAGIDVDIVTEIAKRLGVKLDFKNYDWDDLFIATNKGEIDLAISSITITPERERLILFSIPYFNAGQAIITNTNNEIKGINDLKDKKIAVEKNTTGHAEAKKYTQENLIYTFLNPENDNDMTHIINDLKNNEFDAIIVDYVQALDITKKHAGVKIVGVPFTKENYGIATKISNDSLIKEVNFILQGMIDDGTLETIKTNWTKF